MPQVRFRVPYALLSVVLMACGARWEYVEPSTTIEPKQQVQVWHAGHAVIWHAVRFDSVAVTGIPYHRSRSCESCRESLARSEVDSLRFGSLHGGLRNTAFLVAAIMGLVGYLFRGIGGS